MRPVYHLRYFSELFEKSRSIIAQNKKGGIWMSFFRKLVSELASVSGLPLEVDNSNSFSIEYDDLIITLQYRKDQDDVAIFSPVTDPESISIINESVLRQALTLSFNGSGTNGNFLGLFDDELILSSFIKTDNLTVEKLSEKIFLFKDAAIAVRDSLLNSYDDAPVRKEAVNASLNSNSLSV